MSSRAPEATSFRAFLGNVLRVMTGTTLGQVVMIAALPLLTRIYSPAAFTELAVVSAATAILTPLVLLRFDNAVLTASGEATARAATALAFVTLAGLGAAVAAAGMAVAWTGVGERMGIGPRVAAIAGAAILLQGSVYTLTQLALWRQRFRLVSRSKVVLAVALVGAQVGLSPVLPGGAGLSFGFALGLGGAAAYLALANRRFLAATLRDIRWRRLAARLRRQRPFALYTAPSNAVNAASFQFQPLAIIALFGETLGAMYFLAARAVSVPGRFIGWAVSGAFWADAARLYASDPERLMARQVRTVALLAAIGLPGFLLLPFGEAIFAVVFGAEWRQAGAFAGVVWVGAYAAFVGDCTGALIYYGRNLWMSLWEIGRLAVICLAFLAAWAGGWSAMGLVWALSLVMLASYALLLGLNFLAIWLRIRELAGCPSGDRGSSP